MNHSRNNITSPPRRVFSDHHYQRESIISSPSFTSSTFNNFQVGLVKVYQSDEECSTDSFSINSKNFYDVNNSVNNDHSDSLSSPNYKHSSSTLTPAFDDKFLFTKWDELPSTLRDNIVIPKSGIERPQYVLDKIVESYQSEKGVFLTSFIFLNRKIYQQPEPILNGSVKINIIQELSSLLRKFGGDNNEHAKLTTIESTLLYYKKLMDAFDVFQTEGHNSSFDSDTASTNSSIMTSGPYKTSSRESLKTPLNRTYSSIPVSKTQSNTSAVQNKALPSPPEPEKKKRNSLILDKFRGKIKAKPKRHSLNPDTRLTQAQSPSSPIEKTRANLHSRSISVSSTASSRSVKDQATIHDYLKAIENLQFTLNTINRQVSPATKEQFNLVVEFLTENIVRFVLADMTYLAMRFLKNSANDFV